MPIICLDSKGRAMTEQEVDVIFRQPIAEDSWEKEVEKKPKVQLLTSRYVYNHDIRERFRFRTWKRVQLGVGPMTVRGIIHSLERRGIQVTPQAKSILTDGNVQIRQEKQEIKLVRTSVAELGFKRSAFRRYIYQSAQEKQLSLCPPEVMLRLLLQDNGRFAHQWFRLASHPLFAGEGNVPGLLIVKHTWTEPGKLQLILDAGFHGSRWYYDWMAQWIFMRVPSTPEVTPVVNVTSNGEHSEEPSPPEPRNSEMRTE